LKNAPSINVYILSKTGKLSHLGNDAGYQATLRVMDKMGLGNIKISRKTAEPYEE